MADKELPSCETLRNLFHYNAETGVITHRERTPDMFGKARGAAARAANFNALCAGKPAGALRDDGYIQIAVCGRLMRAHRIAWALHYGEWPTAELDHINHRRADNRICNLRLVTRRENQWNLPRPQNNKSGKMGVCWCPRTETWRAQIGSGKTYEHLGRFSSFAEACRAREEAERRWGVHENHGKSA